VLDLTVVRRPAAEPMTFATAEAATACLPRGSRATTRYAHMKAQPPAHDLHRGVLVEPQHMPCAHAPLSDPSAHLQVVSKMAPGMAAAGRPLMALKGLRRLRPSWPGTRLAAYSAGRQIAAEHDPLWPSGPPRRR